MNYSSLLSAGKIGRLELENRVVMAPMSEGMGTYHGEASEELLAYYSARAKGGTGLVIVGATSICENDATKVNQFKIFNNFHISGLRRLAERVHRYGGRVFIQLNHAGREADVTVTGVQPVAPSPIPMPFPGAAVPHELTVAEIEKMEKRFIFAATLCMRAGIDGVEIHSAHGYLLNQFASLYTNKRCDEYGGCLENRLRIHKRIIEGIRSNCGDYPISVRVSADELVEGGMKIEESTEMAKLLAGYGVDMINVSAGGYQAPHGVIGGPDQEQGWLVPLAAAIKKAVSIPVTAVSLIRDFDYADKLIAEGHCDYVALGRPLIVDPNLVNKLKTGRVAEIRPCIACSFCQDSAKYGGFRCSINPVMAQEKDFSVLNHNGNGRKVAVIGAGPAGMEAARILAMRGFAVTLFEKTERIGGQVNLSAVPPHKYRMLWLTEYYEANLKRLGVDVRLKTAPTLENIEALNPFAVFLSSGSVPVIPRIPGIDGSNVITAEALLGGKGKISNSEVVVVGTGNTGIETTAWLLEQGNRVTMADMLKNPADKLLTSGVQKMMKLKKMGVPILTGHQLKEIRLGCISFIRLEDGETIELKADQVVLALGVRPENSLKNVLSQKFDRVEVLGDAVQTGQIFHAVRSGFDRAFLLDNTGSEL